MENFITKIEPKRKQCPVRRKRLVEKNMKHWIKVLETYPRKGNENEKIAIFRLITEANKFLKSEQRNLI